MPKRECLVCHRGRWIWVVPHVARLVGWDCMHKCNQKGEVWLQRRQHMLTASAVATALDMNPYETRDGLIKQYAGVGRPSFTGNVATRHGELHEDNAVEVFERQTGKQVLCFGLMPYFSRNYLYLGGSVDGITACGELLEVKCPYRRKPTGVVPAYYLPQVQSLMCGLDLNVANFVEYVPESTWVPQYFAITVVPRDNAFLTRNYAYLREFWYRVCMCRLGADALCFQSKDHPPKKKRKRKSLPVLVKIPVQINQA